MMAPVGFDQRNLEAAVSRVMQLAAERGQKTIYLLSRSPREPFDLEDADQVRSYLMQRAEEAYAESSNAPVAQVRAVVYWSIGLVFEQHVGEMTPPPLCRSAERPFHLAYFWQVL